MGVDKKFLPIFYRACDYLSFLRLKFIHVSERGPTKKDVSYIDTGIMNACSDNTKNYHAQRYFVVLSCDLEFGSFY